MKLVNTIVACTLAAGLVAACGGSDSGVSDGPATNQTLDAIAASFCDRIATCFGDFFVKAFLGDTRTCKTRLQIEVRASVKGLGVQVKDSEAVTCKAAVDAAACNTLLADGVSQCEFRGTLADGAACASDSQCTSGACFVDAKTDCGKCGARAAEAADCTSAKCQRGLTCTSAKKCAKFVPAGGACDATTSCEPSLSCIDGKCNKGLAKDAACKLASTTSPCDTFSGLFCKPPSAMTTDGKCTLFTVVAAGQQCGVSLQPAIDYAACGNSQCVGAQGLTKGTCAAYLADGVACDATKAPGCQFPAKCRNGKCATLDATVCK